MCLNALFCRKLTSLTARIVFLKTSHYFYPQGTDHASFILTNLSKPLLHVMENASLIQPCDFWAPTMCWALIKGWQNKEQWGISPPLNEFWFGERDRQGSQRLQYAVISDILYLAGIVAATRIQGRNLTRLGMGVRIWDRWVSSQTIWKRPLLSRRWSGMSSGRKGHLS